MTLFTVGHGRRSLPELAAVLADAGVSLLVDVRRFPGSTRNPHLSRAELERELPRLGVAYQWCEALGGRRSPAGQSRHPAWRNQAFAAYADHMDTPEFRSAFDTLLGQLPSPVHGASEPGNRMQTHREAQGRVPAAVMCAETLWWRCHRRLIADAATLAGVEVVHLLDVGRREPHRLHPAVRPDAEGRPVYDGGQEDLALG